MRILSLVLLILVSSCQQEYQVSEVKDFTAFDCKTSSPCLTSMPMPNAAIKPIFKDNAKDLEQLVLVTKKLYPQMESNFISHNHLQIDTDGLRINFIIPRGQEKIHYMLQQRKSKSFGDEDLNNAIEKIRFNYYQNVY
jgi:hypothetical protein